MSKDSDNQRRIVEQLAGLVQELLQDASEATLEESYREGDTSADDLIASPSCVLLSLPDQFQLHAARTAIRHNPRNSGAVQALRSLDGRAAAPQKLRIAVNVQRYWGASQRTLTVSFVEQTSRELRDRIIGHMNAWNKTAGISFAYVARQGNVRITRAGKEYKSFIGTDILHINLNSPTMWLGGFSMSTPESEYLRVVRHETGHTMGFPHEHMRPELVARLDPQKCYRYFQRFGWNQSMVDSQVLTPLSGMSIFATDPDQTSIMCYQLPGSCTKDGRPITGGRDINATDFWFAGRIYPKADAGHAPQASTAMQSQPFAQMPEEEADVDLTQFTETPLDL